MRKIPAHPFNSQSSKFDSELSKSDSEKKNTPILNLKDVSVSFDGFNALNKLSLSVHEGELLCIIGPNGAGKTTMMDVITGKIQPDTGSIFFEGVKNILEMEESAIAQAGICRKFQKPSVFMQLSVFKNLELALKSNKGVWQTLFSQLSIEDRETIERIMETITLSDVNQKLAKELSHGQKQWLEIGMLLIQDPKIMLVDEPVAGMTELEIQKTTALLLSLRGVRSIVIVDHDMQFIRSIANKVIVMHEGSVLKEGTMDEVSNDPHVIQVYLGE